MAFSKLRADKTAFKIIKDRAGAFYLVQVTILKGTEIYQKTKFSYSVSKFRAKEAQINFITKVSGDYADLNAFLWGLCSHVHNLKLLEDVNKVRHIPGVNVAVVTTYVTGKILKANRWSKVNGPCSAGLHFYPEEGLSVLGLSWQTVKDSAVKKPAKKTKKLEDYGFANIKKKK